MYLYHNIQNMNNTNKTHSRRPHHPQNMYNTDGIQQTFLMKYKLIITNSLLCMSETGV